MPDAQEWPGQPQILADVQRALAEDIGSGDCTAQLIPAAQSLQTRVICRQHAVLAGRDWFSACFAQTDAGIHIEWALEDGAAMAPDQEICRLSGPARGILSAERCGLNFLQTLSATATVTAQYVQAVDGTGVTIIDTRKTIPGLRLAQKYAVRCGGAANHRIGLFDAILIKENHIAAAGSITAAVQQAGKLYPKLLLETEVETLAQLDEAVACGAQRALLDNFSVTNLRRAVAAHGHAIELEASGGISLETVRAVAETGVHFISIGALTKHVEAVDFSMRYI